VFYSNTFVTETIGYVKKHDFDGVEIDYRYPVDKISKEQHSRFLQGIHGFELISYIKINSNYLTAMRFGLNTLKTETKKTYVLLTTMPADVLFSTEFYNANVILEETDYVSMIPLDFIDAEPTVLYHMTPIFCSTKKKWCLEHSVERLLIADIYPYKIIVGRTFYSICTQFKVYTSKECIHYAY